MKKVHRLAYLSLFGWALIVATPGFSQAPHLSFSGARQDIPYLGSFAVADFNGDGYPDIVTSNSGNQVAVLLNDGTGHYIQSAIIQGTQGQYFVTGDFNNDGFADIAFSTYSTIYVALGAGNGTFRNLKSFSGGTGGDLKVADLNGDGKLDLVVGGYQVGYFLGNGDGTLRPFIALSPVASPYVVADVNGDGKPDVIGVWDNVIYALINSGNGIFTGVTSGTDYQPLPTVMAAGDLTGSGIVDLVIAGGNPKTMEILSGDGTGHFSSVASQPLSYLTNDIALLDVNADGKLDIVYNRQTSTHNPFANLVVQQGTNTLSFGLTTTYATYGAESRILLADTRKSGHLDLMLGGNSGISILPNKGDGTFVQGSYFTEPGTLQSTVSGDFNHDGIRDLVVSIRKSTSGAGTTGDSDSQFAGAYVLLGTGNPSAPFSTGQRMFVPPDVLALTTADFNHDGNPDLAFLTGQDLVIYLGNPDGTFTAGAQYPCTATALTFADFNGDGRLDIATNGVLIFPGKGDGTFSGPTFAFAASGNFAASADFNSDGKADLIVGSSNGFLVAFGNGDGTFANPTPGGINGLISGVVADFNNDGVPDFAELETNGVSVYLNVAGTLTQSINLGTPQNARANNIAAADFNHDGRMDIAIPGLDFTVFTGNGDGTFAPGQVFGSANYSNEVIAADFYDFGTASAPDLIGVGQNGAISTLFNQSH